MQEQEGDTEPSHHARRPMNAFLIFCKRHRSVVRDRYPNLENRSITKILGEWWANLDKEEKACYTGLAKQYKDAFFNANPDFKWYKLPAPPLRTLAPRPPPARAPSAPPPSQDDVTVTTNNNSTKLDLNKKSREAMAMFTPGKLADESNMGGLSRLLDAATAADARTPNPYYSPTPYRVPVPENRDNTSIRDLQHALTETTRVFEDFETKERYQQPGDLFTNQDVIDQIVDKRFSDEYYRQWSDDEKARSGRSCKGKRYQEFMALGGLLVNKRQRRDGPDRPDEAFNASCSWDNRSEESITEAKTPEPLEDMKQDIEDQDNSAAKAFKAADFDLDAKIAALPSLSLEKFQQRKRENKRRKKSVNLKPKHSEVRETAESWRSAVIGSQKRKPRKVSITRFEPGSLNNLTSSAPPVAEAPSAPMAPRLPLCARADLLALATLAEVAACTSKLSDDGPNLPSHDYFTAKSSDGNASTV